MPLDDIIAEVATVLSGVSGIGVVHSYIRAVRTEAEFLAAFVTPDTSQVRAWTITREATAVRTAAVHHDHDTHAIVIRGWMGLRDADGTEETFQALIESVRAAFRGKATLDGKAHDCGPMQVRMVTQGLIFGVLCHYCELTLPVSERSTW